MKVLVAILFGSLIACSGGVHLFCEIGIEDNEFCLIQPYGYNRACDTYFPAHTAIQIQDYSLDYLSPSLMYRMSEVEKLDIIDSRVVKAYVKPTLDYLRISQSELAELEIDTAEEYQLSELHLPHNSLKQMPAHLNHLKNLTLLDLSNNWLEYVDMGQLDNLHDLKMLVLSNNKIKVIFASRSARLNTLQEVYLARNLITALDISRWETPALKDFRISYNFLRSVEYFPEKFPKLEVVQLEENLWDCSWREEVTKQLKAANNTSLLTKFVQLECSTSIKNITARAKNEATFENALKETITQFVGKSSISDNKLDEIVQDLLCKIDGE